MLALMRCLAEETEEMKISVFGVRQASETPPKPKEATTRRSHHRRRNNRDANSEPSYFGAQRFDE